MKRSARLALSLAIAVLALAAWAGNYHFVYGTPVAGVQRFDKTSWSLSETVVNADTLNGLPAFALAAQYPLFMQAANRNGLLR